MTNKVVGIYCITNLINNKKYFGQSVNIIPRIRTHKLRLIRGEHKNLHLQSAWNFYGEQNFQFDIIEECSENELDVREVFYIENFNTINRLFGYNLDSGGNKNKHRSRETREKMSKIMSGRVVSDETKLRLSKALSGRKMHENTRKALQIAKENLSPESRKIMSEKARNRTMSNSTRKKLSIIKSGKPISETHKEKISNSMRGKKRKITNRTSKYIGVRKSQTEGKWVCIFKVRGKSICGGTFLSEEDAALRYNELAVKIFGEDTILNATIGKNPI